MLPKKSKNERKFELIVNENPEPSEHVEKAARAGERILSSVGYSKDADVIEGIQSEAKIIAHESRAIARLIEEITDVYDAREMRDKNAGKLLQALLFMAQAGLSKEAKIDLLNNYTKPAASNDREAARQTGEECARLADALLSLESLLDNLFGDGGEFTPAKLDNFRREENSPVWDQPGLKDKLLEAATKAYDVAKYKADQHEDDDPVSWLYSCSVIICEDGMKMSTPDEEDGEEVWNNFLDAREDKFEEAWEKWLPRPKPRGPVW